MVQIHIDLFKIERIRVFKCGLKVLTFNPFKVDTAQTQPNLTSLQALGYEN